MIELASGEIHLLARRAAARTPAAPELASIIPKFGWICGLKPARRSPWITQLAQSCPASEVTEVCEVVRKVVTAEEAFREASDVERSV
jgi:hypothetical protein